MKLLKFVLVVALMLLVMPQAMAIDIDGDLSDWGLGGLYTSDWSVNDTWVPNSGVYYVVEDNQDPRHGGIYPTSGVHIRGVGPTYQAYIEPLLVKVHDPSDTEIPPAGGEFYDVEAVYVTENDTTLFVAIITSCTPPVWGDLALDLDGDGQYEYGVIVHGFPTYGYVPNKVHKVKIYNTSGENSWEPAWNYVPEDGPYINRINEDNAIFTGNYASLIYVDSGIVDNGYTNYFVEIAIPKDAVGMAGKNLPDPPLPKRIYFPENCGNDSGGITIPEFPVLLIPLGVILGAIYFFRRK